MTQTQELIELTKELAVYKIHSSEKYHRFYHLIRTLNIKVNPSLMVDGNVNPYLFRWSSTFHMLIESQQPVKYISNEDDDFWTTL